jgi:hypothetical protein
MFGAQLLLRSPGFGAFTVDDQTYRIIGAALEVH